MNGKVTLDSLEDLILSINRHLKAIKNLRLFGDEFSVRVDREPIQYNTVTKYRISIDGPQRTQIWGKESKIRNVAMKLHGLETGLALARKSLGPSDAPCGGGQ